MAELTCRVSSQATEVTLGGGKATVVPSGALSVLRAGTEITLTRTVMTQVEGGPKALALASYTISNAPGKPDFVVSTELATDRAPGNTAVYHRFGGTFRSDLVAVRNRSDVGSPMSSAPITTAQALAIEGTILTMLGVRCTGGDISSAAFTDQNIQALAAGRSVKVRQQGN